MRYEDVEWQAAACKGLHIDFFYSENVAESLVINPKLRRICKSCPIFSECREYAIENEHYGFWAGLTDRERRPLRARKAKATKRVRNAA